MTTTSGVVPLAERFRRLLARRIANQPSYEEWCSIVADSLDENTRLQAEVAALTQRAEQLRYEVETVRAAKERAIRRVERTEQERDQATQRAERADKRIENWNREHDELERDLAFALGELRQARSVPKGSGSAPAEQGNPFAEAASLRDQLARAREVVEAAKREEERHLRDVATRTKGLTAEQRSWHRMAHTAGCDLAGVLAVLAESAPDCEGGRG